MALKSNDRIGWLDGWRAIAVGIVILSHIAGLYNWPFDPPGKLGVFLFFSISGYIVTKLLFVEKRDTGAIDVAAFYRRRAARILPPLLIYLFTCLALGLNGWSALVRSALFTCNVAVSWGDCGWLYGHTWSLAFEEQYYLLLPFLFMQRRRWLLIFVIPLVIVPFILPINWIGRIGFLQIYMLLGLGATFAIHEGYFSARFAQIPPVFLVFALIAAGFWCGLAPGGLQIVTGLFIPFAITLAIFGLPLGSPWVRGVLETPVLRRIGLYSYSLYLWQQLALMHAPWNTGIMPLFGLAGAFAIAAISYHTVEKYFRLIARRVK